MVKSTANAKQATASKAEAKQATAAGKAKAKGKEGKAKVLAAIAVKNDGSDGSDSDGDDSDATVVNDTGHYVCSRDGCRDPSVLQTAKPHVSYCKFHDEESGSKRWIKECWKCRHVYLSDVKVCSKADCGAKLA